MNPVLIVLLALLTFGNLAYCQLSEPHLDYYNQVLQARAKDRAVGVIDPELSNVIYKWSADLGGGGSQAVLLIMKDFFNTELHDGSLPSWAVYIPKTEGTGYLRSQDFEVPLDIDKIYVGQVSKLKKRGIVTLQIDRPRKGAAVARVFAYTIEGDHLKENKLAEYNPDEGGNSIFNQYLTDAKRTHVTLQEIAP